MEDTIIEAIKTQYNRDLRKQLVKTMLANEKNGDKEAIASSYKIINQIFSYVIGEVNWSMPVSTNDWDDTPLRIISGIFPKIEKTQWYKDQQLQVTKAIELDGDFI